MPSSISKSTCVKVCPASGRWKASFVFLQWAVFFLCARAMAEQVVFTEIHYNPPAGKPEFIEVYNNTSTIFDIPALKLKKIGLRFTEEPLHSYVFFYGLDL